MKKNKFIEFLFKVRASKHDKERFFENFSMILSSGVDVVVALNIIEKDTRSRSIKLLVTQVKESINEGNSIHESLKKTNILPTHLLSVIQIGEESGNLSQNLNVVSKQIKKQREFKDKIRSASLYPLFVVLLMFVVGSGLLVFVLPRLTTVYKNLDIDLPLITRILIKMGELAESYGKFIFPVLILVIIAFLVSLKKVPSVKKLFQEIIFKVPILKNVYREAEVARFGFLLGSLLQTGYPIVSALELLEYSTEIFRFKSFYNNFKFRIAEGLTIQQAFDQYKNIEDLIPAYAREMIISSEQSGDLSKSLQQIGKIYEKKNESTLKDFGVLIEPVLLVLVWIGVAFVAFAVVLPIYSLVGNVTDISDNGNTVDLDTEP